MRSVFITGATGFVGTQLVQHLCSRYKIIGVTTKLAAVRQKTNRVLYEVGDITDPVFLHSAIAKYKPSHIVHLAAKTRDWFDDPTSVFRVNVLGTINLYEAILTVRKQTDYNPKILYVGSSEAYGNTTNPRSIKESFPLMPVNHYSASKASADLLSYEYSQLHNLRIIIARPFTHLGPGQPLRSFVSSVADQIARLEISSSQPRELLVGNLQAVRDYLDVEDVVSAYESLLEYEASPGEIFNVCSGQGIPTRDILRRLIGMSSVGIAVREDPGRIRPIDTLIFIGDNKKLRQLTGWEPRVDLTTSLENLLQWRRNYLASTPTV